MACCAAVIMDRLLPMDHVGELSFEAFMVIDVIAFFVGCSFVIISVCRHDATLLC